uniref:Secreted protein n=1 Tax=Acrobeloides nanus TaxID=290746 RepID=A0A914E2K4_9BILA
MKRLISILFISFGLALIDKNLQSKSDEQVGSRVEDTNGTDAICVQRCGMCKDWHAEEHENVENSFEKPPSSDPFGNFFIK